MPIVSYNVILPLFALLYIIQQKMIQNNIIQLQADIQNIIRNLSIPLLHNLKSTMLYKDHTDFLRL